MLKDITIGQFFPGNSVIHRLDARMKLVLTMALIVMIFVATKPIGLVVSFVYVVIAYGLSKLSPKLILKSLKPVVPIVIFTGVLNMFFIAGEPLVSFWIFNITKEGVKMAVFMAIRVILLIAGSSLLTYTTSPIELTDGIERLLAPLNKIRFPVHELAMMMTIALRFIPTLIEETDKIMSAQKARGADLESGSIIQRAKALIPILVPLFISAFRRADELALAMECRCYRGGEGRTRMKILKTSAIDWVSLFVTAVCIAGVILINIFL
ncbi:MAG: energy-coupling factor transporter transmembrane protein EcfT [Oscillospiraceae bacterium]|nr:energy-coupling factor transporter transmembrane protein EcfT [Oscillospiraceae bacterium]